MWRKKTPCEDEFARLREEMVRSQIAARDVHNPIVLEAMRRVPRHLFVPEEQQEHAYEDHPVPIGAGQTISQPYMVGIMTQLLELKRADRVLEIGTGSGYQTAILAELAGHVISIERERALAERARAVLARMGYEDVEVIEGDGTVGAPDRAPFDAILVTAAGPGVPASLKDQLAQGGRLVCPAGPRDMQQLVKIVRTASGLHEHEGINCVFVPLIGAEGWPEQ